MFVQLKNIEKSFGGIGKGKQGSVVFIVETEEVKTQDKN